MTKKLEQHEQELDEIIEELGKVNIWIKIEQKKRLTLSNRKSSKELVIKEKKNKLKFAIDK